MPERGGEFELIIERTETLNSDAVIHASFSTLTSSSHTLANFRVVRTDTTETSNISLTSIEFIPTKSVVLYYIHLKCRGLTGIAAQVYLSIVPTGGSQVDSDIINIGTNVADYISHKFTFASPVFIQAGDLGLITITELSGQVDVKCGIDDNSGWDVTGNAD